MNEDKQHFFFFSPTLHLFILYCSQIKDSGMQVCSLFLAQKHRLSGWKRVQALAKLALHLKISHYLQIHANSSSWPLKVSHAHFISAHWFISNDWGRINNKERRTQVSLCCFHCIGLNKFNCFCHSRISQFKHDSEYFGPNLRNFLLQQVAYIIYYVIVHKYVYAYMCTCIKTYIIMSYNLFEK